MSLLRTEFRNGSGVLLCVLLLILWGRVAALTVDVKISVMLLSPRILRKGVFYSQNVMPFKQVNRKSTLPTKEVL